MTSRENLLLLSASSSTSTDFLVLWQGPSNKLSFFFFFSIYDPQAQQGSL